MGTRGLTAVMVDGVYKIAQYGQWDHYPTGQGTVVLKFCQEHLTTAEGRAVFREKLQQVRFSNNETELERSTFERTRNDYISGGTKTMAYPYAGRDNGAEILNLLWRLPDNETIVTRNQIGFAGDSLFCEWAYVIDLNLHTLEVYKGFQREPIPEGERFSALPHEVEYWPVRRVRAYKLDDLPSVSGFIRDLEPPEES